MPKEKVAEKVAEKEITVKIIHRAPARRIPIVEGDPEYHYGWLFPVEDEFRIVEEGWIKVKPDEIKEIPNTVERTVEGLRLKGSELMLFKIPQKRLEQLRNERAQRLAERFKGLEITKMRREEL